MSAVLNTHPTHRTQRRKSLAAVLVTALIASVLSFGHVPVAAGLPDPPTNAGALTLPAGQGQNELVSAVRVGSYAYFGTATSPGRVIKVDLDTFEPDGVLTLQAGEDNLTAAVTDGTYAYFGTQTSPGRVVKVNLATFEREDAITLEPSEASLRSAVIAGDFGYFGTDTFPGRVIKVDLDQLERVDALTLGSGENALTAAVTDGTFGYFGTETFPARVIKVDLDALARVDAVTLAAGENFAGSAVTDGTHGYFGTQTAPGKVVKINLGTLARVDAVTLGPGDDFLLSAITDGTYGYFGTGETDPEGGTPKALRVIKLDLANLTRVGAVDLDGPPTTASLTSAVIDGAFGYFGTNTAPGRVAKIQLVPLPPDPPTGVSATPGNSQLGVTWLAPDNDGGRPVTGYTATATPGGATCTATAPTTNCTITGLTNGTAYTVTVTATNDAGTGEASEPSEPQTPFTTPGAPTSVETTPGDTTIAVTWQTPVTDGGRPVTGYTATATPGDATCTATAPTTNCTITGLTNGTAYTVTVTATNDAGTGETSEPVAATPFGPPGAPAMPTGQNLGPISDTDGQRGFRVRYTPDLFPAGYDNGGRPIADVEFVVFRLSDVDGTEVPVFPVVDDNCLVQPAGDSNGPWCNIERDANPGLFPGSFVVQVLATNTGGLSSGLSQPADIFVPDPPAPPVITDVDAASQQVTVTWDFDAPGGVDPGFVATATGGDPEVTSSCSAPAQQRSCVIDDLTNGLTYEVTVEAFTTAGRSGPSAPASVTLPLSPNQPLPPVLSLFEGGIVSQAGEPVDGPLTEPVTMDIEIWESDTLGQPVGDTAIRSCSDTGIDGQCVETGLVLAATYVARIRTVNASGTSLWSSFTGPVTPWAGSAEPEFLDVPDGSFFVRPTSMLKLRGITEGTNPAGDRFTPQRPVNRQQMAAFLWRLAGEPDAPETCGFTDEDDIPGFARQAACWLKETGITTNNPYEPAGIVNRQQMAAFLWRFAGEPDAPETCGFTDTDAIRPFARQAACWLKETDITTNNPYNPAGIVNRAQMSAFLYRLGAEQGLWLRTDD